MLDQEDIASQRELLGLHRRLLSTYLMRLAQTSSAFAQPEVVYGIQEARSNIGRIKAILRAQGVMLEDHPGDDNSATSPLRRAKVFINYKHGSDPDEAVALTIRQVLGIQYDVFIDQLMPLGARWAEQIETALRESDFLITFLSANSVGSELVAEVISQAHRLAAIHSGRPIILPVRLNYHAPFQYPLSAYLDHLNWAFWRGPADTERLIDELRRAIDGGTQILSDGLTNVSLFESSITSVQQPAPVAQPGLGVTLEMAEGTMNPQSAFYVERVTDSVALDTIHHRGVTITIKGPRQMGKSSLLIRTMSAAQQAGKRVAFLDFQLFDRTALADADIFFRQFCIWLTNELELEDRSDEYWSKPLGNIQRCTLYVGRYVLNALDSPLVLAMDEVESIFDTDFRSDFFAMLRSWHNSRATGANWRWLDLVLVTSTEPYQLINNLNQSPFNVGQVVELTDFTAEQLSELHRRHGSPLNLDEERRLMELLRGHPYLTRRSLYLVASGRISTTDLFASATDDRGPFGDHLRYHLFRMHQEPKLIRGLRAVLHTNTCDDDNIYWRLRGAGLVRREGVKILPRNQLYADYFREHIG